MRPDSSPMRRWWGQPDQFDAMTALLHHRGLLRATRLLLTGTAIAAGITPLVMLTQPMPSNPLAEIASALGALYVALAAGFYARRWPTRRASAALALGGAAVIAGWSVTQPDATLQFLACAVMIIPGSYLAIFHSTKLMVPCFAVSATTAFIAALHASRLTDVATAGSSFCVLWLLTVVVPLGARGLARAMTHYATDAHHDPLTGLLNRRGFTQQLLSTSRPSRSHTHIAVLLVDVDGFKSFNDTHGHPHGDQLLIAVADLLVRSCPTHASICRAGGEEFLIAYSTVDPGPPPVAQKLCRSIAALPHNITVSIGTSTVAVSALDSSGSLSSAISAADTAMYTAKRLGGNHTAHSKREPEPGSRDIQIARPRVQSPPTEVA